MPADPRPVLGACLPIASLPAYREWILADQRDVELQDFCFAEVLDAPDWKDRAARAREMLAGHTGRLGLHGPFWGFSIASPDPEIRAVVRRRLDQGLDACAETGATQMVVHSPYTTWMHNNLDMDHKARAEVTAHAHDTLLPAARRAEALGVTLVIENIEDKDPRDRAHLALSIGLPSVKLSVDTGHANYAHGSTGAPPPDYFITAAGDLLDHVHLQDTDGYADRHWPPGEGNIRWTAVFAALATLETMPRLMIELRDKGRIRQAAEYLAGLGLAR
ncbi:sugar phosphate isomerase/epimerase [Roseomonas sp. HJA6]|uniref:Sugar phosphate isomerase/epimerase n=1 Tax=Roseomonas alba TaxID=2846776 RepID=A0ABS7AGP8_9PROT|nr:sugar phosphate isomerase/epimerase family protein [Neoroseomonas alba]MBW6401469.1 sugar phosphate isomerase/epimerase [Neoroseomonas alba]